MIGTVSVEEPRAVGQVRRRPTPPGQRNLPAKAERVALVVVEVEIAGALRNLEVSETAGHGAGALHPLPRVGEMQLGAAQQARRAHAGLPAANASALDGQREKNIRIAERVVVEEIARAGSEVREVEAPAFHRDGKAEFVLLVALALERQESEALAGGEFEHRPAYAEQRRRLVVAAVEAAQHPLETRNPNCGPYARVGCGLVDRAGEVRDAQAAIEREPARQPELVFGEERVQRAPDLVAVRQRG